MPTFDKFNIIKKKFSKEKPLTNDEPDESETTNDLPEGIANFLDTQSAKESDFTDSSWNDNYDTNQSSTNDTQIYTGINDIKHDEEWKEDPYVNDLDEREPFPMSSQPSKSSKEKTIKAPDDEDDLLYHQPLFPSLDSYLNVDSERNSIQRFKKRADIQNFYKDLHLDKPDDELTPLEQRKKVFVSEYLANENVERKLHQLHIGLDNELQKTLDQLQKMHDDYVSDDYEYTAKQARQENIKRLDDVTEEAIKTQKEKLEAQKQTEQEQFKERQLLELKSFKNEQEQALVKFKQDQETIYANSLEEYETKQQEKKEKEINDLIKKEMADQKQRAISEMPNKKDGVVAKLGDTIDRYDSDLNKMLQPYVDYLRHELKEKTPEWQEAIEDKKRKEQAERDYNLRAKKVELIKQQLAQQRQEKELYRQATTEQNNQLLRLIEEMKQSNDQLKEQLKHPTQSEAKTEEITSPETSEIPDPAPISLKEQADHSTISDPTTEIIAPKYDERKDIPSSDSTTSHHNSKKVSLPFVLMALALAGTGGYMVNDMISDFATSHAESKIEQPDKAAQKTANETKDVTYSDADKASNDAKSSDANDQDKKETSSENKQGQMSDDEKKQNKEMVDALKKLTDTLSETKQTNNKDDKGNNATKKYDDLANDFRSEGNLSELKKLNKNHETTYGDLDQKILENDIWGVFNLLNSKDKTYLTHLGDARRADLLTFLYRHYFYAVADRTLIY